jgi:NAD(P)H-dependent flavin oxidoreductase YrpB (nitropropane dioxygenase family)
VAPRVLRNSFIDLWNGRDDQAWHERERLAAELTTSIREQRAHELIPITGEVAGIVTEILPAGEIVRRMVAEAEVAARSAAGLMR